MRKIKKYNRSDKEFLKKFVVERNVRCYLEAVFGIVNLKIDKDLKQLKCPVLLIYGKNDRACPKEVGYDILSKVPKHEATRMVLFENCGHSPHRV